LLMPQTQELLQTPNPIEPLQRPLMPFGLPLGRPLIEHQAIMPQNLQKQVQALPTPTINNP
jgi:hypothetical protein